MSTPKADVFPWAAFAPGARKPLNQRMKSVSLANVKFNGEWFYLMARFGTLDGCCDLVWRIRTKQLAIICCGNIEFIPSATPDIFEEEDLEP